MRAARRPGQRAARLRLWTAGLVISLLVHALVLRLGAELWQRMEAESMPEPSSTDERVTELLLVDEDPSVSRDSPIDSPSVDRSDEPLEVPVPLDSAPSAVNELPPPTPSEVEPDAPEETPEDEPEVDEPQPEAPPEVPTNVPSVAQAESNDERSVEARFLAERDNRVEEETRAARTSLDQPSAENQIAAAERESALTERAAADDLPPESLDPSEEEEAESPDEFEPEEEAAEEAEEEAEEEEAEEQAEPLQPEDDVEPVLVPAEQREAEVTEAAEAEEVVEVEAQEDPFEENEPVEPAETSESREAEEVADDEVLPSEEGTLPVVEPETDATQEGLRSVTAAGAMDRAMRELERSAEPSALARMGQVESGVYAEMFGARDRVAREQERRRTRESTLGGDVQGRWERTRAAMENFDVDVRTGTETHLNTAASPFAGYIHALHNRIHPRWSTYLLWLDRSYGPGSVLADPNLAVTLEYVIHSDGTVANVRIVRTSGEGIFDGEAVNMLWEIGPHAVPPDDMLSYDGKARIHWQFHRDQRMCGTFGASVRFIQEPN